MLTSEMTLLCDVFMEVARVRVGASVNKRVFKTRGSARLIEEEGGILRFGNWRHFIIKSRLLNIPKCSPEDVL